MPVFNEPMKWDISKNVIVSGNTFYKYPFGPKYYSSTNSISLAHANQFNFFATLSDHFWGYDGAASFGLGVNWNITNQLTFTGTPFISSYFFGPLDVFRRVTTGMNAALTYQPANWLILRTYGQYAHNGLSVPNSFHVPQNSFGGEVYVKFSETFGLGGGIKYVNYAGKWRPQYYGLPIIKLRVK
ncbi:MAG: hypothetical protein LBE79_07190 [Tannerella sp.]|nr:hypothetical protein [Tannerella sp.]